MLVRRTEQLSWTQRRVLALHYVQKMSVAEIAACLGLTENAV